jgi:hypothetical protein
VFIKLLVPGKSHNGYCVDECVCTITSVNYRAQPYARLSELKGVPFGRFSWPGKRNRLLMSWSVRTPRTEPKIYYRQKPELSKCFPHRFTFGTGREPAARGQVGSLGEGNACVILLRFALQLSNS